MYNPNCIKRTPKIHPIYCETPNSFSGLGQPSNSWFCRSVLHLQHDYQIWITFKFPGHNDQEILHRFVFRRLFWE
jgi:hypothetical protein